ncbi:MAG: hypothetical protein FJ148_27010 [Deltaproteobacteria bacterium]|nr:hypothetical protein [Deltaproteobacteria bacterium]
MQCRVLASAVALAALFASTQAGAAMTLLPGKRLVILNRAPDNEARNKITVTARSGDLAISPPGSNGDPTCTGAGGGGGRLTVTSLITDDTHTTPLPCQNWTGRKTGSWRYNDRFLGDGTCKRVEIRSSRTLKAICLGRGSSVLDFDLREGQAQHPIDVKLELGTGPDRYCMRFGGSVVLDGANGKKFLARDSAAPSDCLP